MTSRRTASRTRRLSRLEPPRGRAARTHRADVRLEGEHDPAEIRNSLRAEIDLPQGQVSATRVDDQGSLFGGPEGDSQVDAPVLPEVPAWTDRERLSFEKELLGFYVSGHPLGSVAADLARLTDTTAAATEGKDGREVRVGGLLTALRETRTRQGKRMGFVGVINNHLESAFAASAMRPAISSRSLARW